MMSRVQPHTRLRTEVDGSGNLTIGYAGRLDAASVGSLWRQTADVLRSSPPKHLRVLTDEITYCDGSGLALLFWLRLQGRQHGFTVEFQNLRPDLAARLNRFDPEAFAGERKARRRFTVTEEIGYSAWSIVADFGEQLIFVGQLCSATLRCLTNPRQLRWKDLCTTAEQAGANAVGIVALIGFLFGLIMAFSSAMPLRQFGADVYVADLAAMALVRVIGPFITAIILAGRTGSAFAAELGTMKINNEIDALNTMGLEPVRFLVVPKVLATMFVTPLLTVLTDLFGLIGSGFVIVSIGFPLITYINHVKSAVDLDIVLVGLLKGVVFGALVGGVGCLRGLQTRTGATAVGISTTRAVVSGIVLVVMAEGVFAVLLHFLGI
ncbi:MAG TPA: ABC transporter permease [Anaerohalosphaeraceae bacterium]|jgi:phospholipid/cholesterol/gamma-HCH transport system permease protein|nr:ABC transporter permease [Anaerohalosphaeraceae bacterium]HRT51298.1 ABC transporter permease [Anaerohalosphaeraceae bacterium]HRT87245.1 ABC transporter permease [Anaerohalosphaeraceae bacterium]